MFSGTAVQALLHYGSSMELDKQAQKAGTCTSRIVEILKFLQNSEISENKSGLLEQI